MKLIEEIVSPTGKHVLRFYVRDDGLFKFEECYESYDDLLGHESLFWAPSYESGLHETFEAAQLEALKITPWLRQDN